MKIDPLEISQEHIQRTIDLLRSAGQRECVLLWLGLRESGAQRITEVYKPIQEASVDYFEIPRQGMAELMARLRVQSLYVASQVHTHPGEAFHSAADDSWAIVRHLGALSIVLPDFATATTAQTFLDQAAVFQLDPANRWIRVRPSKLSSVLRITP